MKPKTFVNLVESSCRFDNDDQYTLQVVKRKPDGTVPLTGGAQWVGSSGQLTGSESGAGVFSSDKARELSATFEKKGYKVFWKRPGGYKAPSGPRTFMMPTSPRR